MQMNEMRRPRVLVAVCEPSLGDLVAQLLEEEGYSVTLVTTARDACAVARGTLRPLVLIMDHGQFLISDDFLTLFTNYADQLPPIAWIALVAWPRAPEGAAAFLADRQADLLRLPFDCDEMLAVVERAAARLGERSRLNGTQHGH
jgi:CheY-like chemotaxis protein